MSFLQKLDKDDVRITLGAPGNLVLSPVTKSLIEPWCLKAMSHEDSLRATAITCCRILCTHPAHCFVVEMFVVCWRPRSTSNSRRLSTQTVTRWIDLHTRKRTAERVSVESRVSASFSAVREDAWGRSPYQRGPAGHRTRRLTDALLGHQFGCESGNRTRHRANRLPSASIRKDAKRAASQIDIRNPSSVLMSPTTSYN